MKVLIFISLALSLPHLALAQGFDGEYVFVAGGSEVVIQIQETGQGQLSGMLTDSDGTRYQVRGSVEQGDARGTLANSQGALYFEAYLENGRLVLAIIPADAYNQPDYLNSKEFILSRRERIRAPLELAQEQPREEPRSSPPPREQRAGGIWEGAFEGEINKVVAKLNLRRYGNQLSGDIDAGGYKYLLEGAVNSSEAWGDVLDPQTQGKMKFSGSLDGDLIELTFSTDEGQFQMEFLREGAKRPSSGNGQQNLAGNWAYTQEPQSGEFAPSKYLLLVLLPDSKFLYGEAKAVRTDPGGKNVGRGQWKTENNVLYIRQGKEWKTFAAFQQKGDSLFLKFSNGSVQQWKRVD
ncbi:MAG: hypothetical protein KDD19_15940 [Phaeodactylibacter sp.]|nr:hypothetical protein [Phaeodactylibacter sp.]MCB9052278.1 hypothetical protein [Lewinellaceae bacterium]